jgi:hypothetical protein
MPGSCRALVAGLVVAAALMLSACSDATAPKGDLLLSVSPDTIRLDPASGMARVLYTTRNSGDTDLLADSRTSVQGESSPGVWRTIMDAVPPMFNNELGIRIPPGDAGQRSAQLPLSAGRYRLQRSYRQSTTVGVDSSFPLEAFSNAFVVLAP